MIAIEKYIKKRLHTGLQVSRAEEVLREAAGSPPRPVQGRQAAYLATMLRYLVEVTSS